MQRIGARAGKAAAAVLAFLLYVLIAVLPVDAAGSSDFEVEGERYGTNRDGSVTVYLNVTNKGDDFGGYVRLLLPDSGGMRYTYYAYEVYVAIAAGETERVQLRLPSINDYEFQEADVSVEVLDEHHNVLSESRLRHFFASPGILYGTLSGSPGDLAYFETEYTSWNSFSFFGSRSSAMEQDFRDLSELRSEDELSGLTYLLIDDYDLSDLSAEGIRAIEDWTRDGGILIIGTGEHEDESFAAFEDDFIDARYLSAEEQGKGVYLGSSYYYSDYGDITFADIEVGSSWSRTWNNGNSGYSFSNQQDAGLFIKQEGRGGIVLAQFSLSDPLVDEYYLVSRLVEYTADLMPSASSGRYSKIGSSVYGNLLRYMQGPAGMNKNVLRLVILLYIVLIGPGLYVVLKARNRREKIWLAIPVVSLVFVLLIFLIGRGFRIQTRQFESVTIASADGTGDQLTQLLGFDSRNREWSIYVDEDTVAAGPAVSDYHYQGDGEYVYLSSIEPRGVRLSYHPNGMFESAFFKTVAPNRLESGGFDCDLSMGSSRLRGEIYNDTDYDYDLFLICWNGEVTVAEGTESGDAVRVNDTVYGSSPVGALLNNARSAYDDRDYVTCREYCALALAYDTLAPYGSFVVGVCVNSEKVITSGAREDAFLCVYEVE